MSTHTIILIFTIVWGAMTASGIWESYVEGRNPWDQRKLGWKISIGSFVLTGYHFFLFWVMYPLLLALPFAIVGWNKELFGVLVSAYATGMVLEDITWYLANPAVHVRELYTPFSDYYPWVRWGGKKILPVVYPGGVLVAMLSWVLLWR